MKTISGLLAVALGSATCFARTNKGEYRQRQNFLSHTAEKGGTNAHALKITNLNDPSTRDGITTSGGDATGIS